jgi:uncharacterized protein
MLGQLLQTGEGSGGPAEGAGYIEQVAGAGGRAAQGFSSGNRAKEDDIGDRNGRLGEVASGQRGFVGCGEGEQAVEEVGKPGGLSGLGERRWPSAAAGWSGGKRTRQAQGKKCGDGTSAHGGQVAEAARQSPVADGFGRMPVEAEVAAGDGEIGGDGQFLARAQAEQGAVVADAEAQSAAGHLRRATADLAEQGQFTLLGVAQGMGRAGSHLLRIGQRGRERGWEAGKSGRLSALRSNPFNAPANAKAQRPRPASTAGKGIICAMAASTQSNLPGAEVAQSATASALPGEARIAPKLSVLETRLEQLGSLMVAYSGGVDSAFLAATAHRVLGSRMLAVLADSPSLARRDLEQARAFARSLKMPLREVATGELERPAYARNEADRCFHCKDELFAVMESLGAELGFTRIAYGMNADDTRDFRPGQRAAEAHFVLAPLAEAGLTKMEVRALAKAAGYPLWDRPAAPCLSSRVEYGRTVTREVLEQVERAEESLRQLGFRELRVRHHGELARVEIARAELPRALAMEMLDAISAALRQAGFQYVTLDCAGFRSGSMNVVLPADVLVRRGASSKI